MGYLLPELQTLAKRRYGVGVFYTCDLCQHPIIDTPVVDPKGGYYRWSPYNSEPKKTYHLHPCADQIFNTSHYREEKRKRRFEEIVDTMRIIYEMLRSKKDRGYWTKDKVQEKLAPKKKRIINRALRQLRKEKKIKIRGGGYVQI